MKQTSLGSDADNTASGAPLNIQSVADAAGVSKTTVSHVLSGNRPVSAQTRRKVEQVMDELGFRPNFFAQALNSKKSHTVALIVQDITNPFYPALARGLQGSVADSDQAVMLFDAGAGAGLTRVFVEEIIQRRVDGVVVAVSNVEDELLELQRAGIAIVAVGSGLSGLPIDWVSADDERIGYDATMHLSGKGHQRIATISGPPSAEPGGGRLAGYVKAMNELGAGVDPLLCAVGDWTREGGAGALYRLLDQPEPPTAVFCANDLMAIGALDAALESHLDVPGDLAIIGVDDIDAASLVRPGLSTVRVPAEEIGRAAGDLLLHRIAEQRTSSYRHVLVHHALIERQTA
ncbi:LacI family DNA-binding transcriptional regulator [Leifsonia poae]|uniref:LacI family DNA-binding transcriptional regulator n=1 Tax=Leifsonia poae TaxID=110933 RepID=UPI001CC0095F|nr:LacI family DNA-binding transcriptional regulator [Leifsonia poae]